jgi:hypothetical protein
MESNPTKKQEFNKAASTEAMLAGKLIDEIELGKIGKLPRNDDEKIKQILFDKFKRHPLFSKIVPEDLIRELKKVGNIFEEPEKKSEKPKQETEPIFIGVNLPQSNLRIVEDGELTQVAKKNIDAQEARRQTKIIFENQSVIESLLKKSEAILQGDFKKEDFIKAGIYSEEEVVAQNKKLEEIKILLDQENTFDQKEIKKLATIFEAIVIKGVNLSKCLGNDVTARPAFPDDDIFEPKIDLYLLLKNIPLGVDVSMRNINGEKFLKKINKNLRTIKKEKKEGIQFFIDANGKLKKNVFAPKIIISCDTSMLRELMFDFKNFDEDKFSEKLKNHRMSREIVSQVIGQCRIFAEFAKNEKQEEVEKYYNNILSIINEISNESIILKRLMSGAGSDSISKKIQEIVNIFKEKEQENVVELEEFRASKIEDAA